MLSTEDLFRRVARKLAHHVFVTACALVAVGASASIASAVCGDDVCNFGETCLNCAADCCPVAPPPCGDGLCEAGETCTSCYFDCCEAGPCGDGVLDAGEACDDGNTSDGDGCDASCQFEGTLVCAGPPNLQHAIWLRAGDVGESTVTFWNNYGRRFDFAQASETTEPTLVPDAVNGHPVVRFQPQDSLKELQGFGGFTDHVVLAVVVPQAGTSTGALFAPNESSTHALSVVDGPNTTYQGAAGPTSAMNVGQAHLVVAQADVTNFALDLLVNSRVQIDGFSGGPQATIVPSYQWADVPGAILGNDATNAAGFDGDIAELIVFKRGLDGSELAEIQTYLAIKYGITLPTDGYLSQGTLLYDDSSFPLAIGGLGRSDCKGLQQTTSSSNVDDMLTVTADGSIDDNQYLLWGTDTLTNTTQTIIATDVGCIGERLSRTYRFANKGPGGAVTSVRVTADITDFGLDLGNLNAVYLFVDDDDNFDAGLTSYVGTHLGGGVYEFSGVVPTDGAFFTIFACPNATCGNGLTEGDEVCDDGNTGDGDGCAADCSSEATLLCGGEQHDFWTRPRDLPSGMAIDWNDVGGPDDLTVLSGPPPMASPAVVDEIGNGMDVVEFLGGTSQALGSASFDGDFTDHTIFVVARPYSPVSGNRTLIASGDDPPRAMTFDGTNLNYGPASAPVVIGQSTIITARTVVTGGADTETSLYIDGVTNGPVTATGATLRWAESNGLYVGNMVTVDAVLDGAIGEVIIFKRALDDTEREIVQTYLALKFALTVPPETYRRSDGLELYGFASHPNHIAGVGREDCQQLDLQQGVSTDGILTISSDSLEDRHYVVVGADDGAGQATPSTITGACSEQRLQRTYRAGTGGFSDVPVRLVFDTSTIVAPEFNSGTVQLLIDDDGDFSSGAQVVTASGGGDQTTVFDVALSHGQHFTLVASFPSPVATSTTATVTQMGATFIPLTGQYSTDNDADLTPQSGPGSLGFYLVDQASDGLFYFPNSGNWSGTDVVTFEACNAFNCCDSATVTLTLDINTAPTSADDSVLVNEDETVLMDVLANDVDDQGDAMTPTVTVDPTSGNATVQPSGQILYAPAAGYSGADSLQYEACDPSGACGDPVVVTIEVNGKPIPGIDGGVVPAGSAVVIDVGTNDTDAEGDALTWSEVGQPQHGTVTHIGGSQFLYTAQNGFQGSDPFPYLLCDEHGACAIGLVNIVATNDPNLAPLATDDLRTIQQGEAVTIDVLANDADPNDGDVLSVSQLVTMPIPTEGVATFDPSGTVVFNPHPDFSGIVAFDYEVCDDKSPALCSQAEIEITVNPATCSDGVCNGSENCLTCTSDCGGCTCGNGSLDPGEECDDGGLDPYDGCDEHCNYYRILDNDEAGVFWVRADWIPGSEGPVTFWDAIGTDFDLTAMTARAPLFDTTTAPTYFNGHPAIDTRSSLYDGMRNLPFDASRHTTFVVDRRLDNNGGTSVISSSSYSTYLWSSSASHYWRYKGRTIYSPEPATNDRPYLHTMQSTSLLLVETATLFLDGEAGTPSVLTGDGTWPGNGITVGDWGTTGFGRWNGQVAEVIVYPGVLGLNDRARIHTYLGIKYGITLPFNEYIALDGTPLYGNPSMAERIVGIGRQDTQGLAQHTTNAFRADWIKLHVDNFAFDNQYALLGTNAGSEAWTGSTWQSYDNASAATYYLSNVGPGGPIADIDLSFHMPASLGSLAGAQVYAVYDDNSLFTSPTEVLADDIDVAGRWVTWSDTNLPSGSYIRLAIVQPALCSDGTLNGTESDVDCGGNCGPCPDGNDCFAHEDCQSQACVGGSCVAPTCSDGIQNQGEEGVDCGGPCVYCGCIMYMTNEQNTCNNLDEDCDGSVDENYDDGIACTLSYCTGGVPQNIPSNLACNDFNGCTQDLCSTGLGGCVNVPDPSGTPDASQDDGDPCTDLRCVGGTTQNVYDGTNVPDDGLFCTTQWCSPSGVQTSIDSGYCVIDGVCVPDGASAGAAPCGVCDTSISQTSAQEHLLDSGFESGNDGWTFQMFSGGWTGVRWSRNDRRSSEGNFSLYFGEEEPCAWWQTCSVRYNYNEGTRVHGAAVSPQFTVIDTARFLTFDIRQDVQDSNTYDVTRLEIRPTSGGSWTQLWSEGDDIDSFETIEIDLSAYVGQTVQVRFRFDTINSNNNDHEGVWIDNIRIRTRCCFVQSDCADADSCTVDFCAGDQTCRNINTCSAGCDAKKNILLVFDYSGSMNGDDGSGTDTSKWEAAVAGLDASMQQFEALMNTSLLLFPSQTQGGCGVNSVPSPGDFLWNVQNPMVPGARAPEFWFGVPRTTLIPYLQGLTPPGATPLARGVRRAGEVYASNHPSINEGKQYVILISDGAEYCGSGDAAAEVQTLYDNGIETYVVGFGSGVDANVLHQAAINGGHAKSIDQAYFSASNAGEMQEVMAEILGELTGEVCNGIDDDCNGSVDDGVPDLSCSVVCNGVAYTGVRKCTNGSYPDTCQVPSIAEVCDGIDNNCDGQIDEGFALGASCTVGVGACQNTGTIVCNGGGNGTVCSALPGIPTAETCDGIDNDCSGDIDENFPEIGQPCDGPDSDSCTNGFYECRADGNGTTCVETGDPNVETCNNLDDDCDGVVDNGFNLGAPCDGSDNDLCNEGVLTCDLATGGVTCTDTTDTNLEVCDGDDDDCDGKVDEGFDVGAPCDGPDADLCRNGVKACTGDGTGTECIETVVFEEYCNGLDDDCDNLVDEPNAIGCIVYYQDSDKDGHGTGPGQCLCTPTGDFTSTLDDDCDDSRPDIYPGAVEVCDGFDQDCDTIVDENPQTNTAPWIIDCYTGPAGTEGVGICTSGQRICQGTFGFGGACEGQQTPLAESCDGADNDCDGTTDEENALGCSDFYPDVDNDTYAGGPSRCLCAAEGEWDHPGPMTDCNDDNFAINPGATEVCDGIDNECDGFIDEDPGDSSKKMTQDCYTGPVDTLGVGTCQGGVETCDSAAGTWGACEDEVTPTVNEICDGLDTDCDGVQDPDEPNDPLGTQPHPCASEPQCMGLSCSCFENSSSEWSCVSD